MLAIGGGTHVAAVKTRTPVVAVLRNRALSDIRVGLKVVRPLLLTLGTFAGQKPGDPIGKKMPAVVGKHKALVADYFLIAVRKIGRQKQIVGFRRLAFALWRFIV